MSGRAARCAPGPDDTGWTYAPIIGWIVTVDLEIVTASSRPELGDEAAPRSVNAGPSSSFTIQFHRNTSPVSTTISLSSTS